MGFDGQPKFVSFDMNGTLIHFRIGDAIRRVLGDRLPPRSSTTSPGRQCVPVRRVHGRVEAVPPDRRRCAGTNLRRFGLDYREGDGRAVYEEIPTWGPYPGVTEALGGWPRTTRW